MCQAMPLWTRPDNRSHPVWDTKSPRAANATLCLASTMPAISTRLGDAHLIGGGEGVGARLSLIYRRLVYAQWNQDKGKDGL